MKAKPNHLTGLFLSFLMNNDLFAVDMKQSRLVRAFTGVKVIPGTSALIVGTTPFEDKEVPVIDLRSKVGIVEKEISPIACIIFLDIPIDQEVYLVALFINSMKGIAKIDTDYSVLSQQFENEENMGMVKEIDSLSNQPVTIINVRNFLSDDELETIILLSENATVH